jgi:hypothetical protein
MVRATALSLSQKKKKKEKAVALPFLYPCLSVFIRGKESRRRLSQIPGLPQLASC